MAKTQFQGEAIYSDVAAQAKAKGQLLGPGLWALHSRATVPFVRVNCGAIGSRNLTWGEVYEVPEGHFGQVINGSFHAGDIVLAEVGRGTPPPRPARITVAAPIVVDTIDGGNITPWVDTRLARRAYLAGEFGGGSTPISYTVQQQSPTQGAPVSPTGNASKNAGIVTSTILVVGPLHILPLGFASSEYLDPAGNTYPDVRPMALQDRARVFVPQPTADAIGFMPQNDAFFILEY
jgi:hypothetical protein